MCKVDSHDDCCGFLKLFVYYGKSVVPVLKLAERHQRNLHHQYILNCFYIDGGQFKDLCEGQNLQ